MTLHKTKEGQAVASEMKRQEAGYWKARLWDHDAIAAAAISAARESEASGDLLRPAMEKFWHDLAGQGDFYNRDGRTDKGDAYRQIAHDLSAALKKIKPPTPPDEASEREHCERVSGYQTSVGRNWAPVAVYDTLLRERAAVRAECQAEIERLKARFELFRNGVKSGWLHANEGRASMAANYLATLLKEYPE